jgi:hypothetical protein
MSTKAAASTERMPPVLVVGDLEVGEQPCGKLDAGSRLP